ncbi:MAG: thiamine-phosphate kinase [Gammaproteobacteria bacterium]|nr:thiamine-phosphate kinase [Gammaproteobacteria bacterium]
MDEFELIRRYFTRPLQDSAGIVLGIGDDGAVTRAPPGEELVIATDTVVAGTHFHANLAPASIGHRALAVNLSDLAAMGARPLWFTLNLCLPDSDPDWLDAFSAGLFALANHHEIALIGGDTVRGPLCVTVTAIGAVPTGQALCRSGAAAGDAIYVTGTFGDAGCIWRSFAPGKDPVADEDLLRAFEYPQPRLGEGRSIRGLASACIDVSDSLQADLGHLLTASDLGAIGDVDCVPVSAALRAQVGDDQAVELALLGGDDYELCFTVPPPHEAELRRVARSWNCPVTRIGETTGIAGLRWRRAGEDWQPATTAFAHFGADES